MRIIVNWKLQVYIIRPSFTALYFYTRAYFTSSQIEMNLPSFRDYDAMKIEKG